MMMMMIIMIFFFFCTWYSFIHNIYSHCFFCVFHSYGKILSFGQFKMNRMMTKYILTHIHDTDKFLVSQPSIHLSFQIKKKLWSSKLTIEQKTGQLKIWLKQNNNNKNNNIVKYMKKKIFLSLLFGQYILFIDNKIEKN